MRKKLSELNCLSLISPASIKGRRESSNEGFSNLQRCRQYRLDVAYVQDFPTISSREENFVVIPMPSVTSVMKSSRPRRTIM